MNIEQGISNHETERTPTMKLNKKNKYGGKKEI
jgi:hypothetical protein